MSTILVGTSGWADHEGLYPPKLPERERLAYYASRFPIVELDATFYHPQPRRTMTAWAERTPPDFLFDVKAFRLLTRHIRDTVPTDENFRSFARTLAPLREVGKLGAIHFQMPPYFQNTEENRLYLEGLRSFFPDDFVAVEFRHRSWLDERNASGTLDLLRSADLVYCVADEPQLGSGSVPPLLAVTHPDLAVIRFHGRNAKTWYARGVDAKERFNYRYSDAELREWSNAIRELLTEAAAVHVFFANKYAGYAVSNAEELSAILAPAASHAAGMEPAEAGRP